MLYQDQSWDEERALYGVRDAQIIRCAFEGPADGESALKETRQLTVEECRFDLRYPLWHVDSATISHCHFTSNCRAALWYDRDISLHHCTLNGTKALRECDEIILCDCQADSEEFSWFCRNLSLKDCNITSSYAFLQSRSITAENVQIHAKYAFQYAENVRISHSRLTTKDAFWHGKNITIEDCEIEGEYLGWYSENLRFVRCVLSGTQPLCYCSNLVLEDCTLLHADFAFEKSLVHAKLSHPVDSMRPPCPGSEIIYTKTFL